MQDNQQKEKAIILLEGVKKKYLIGEHDFWALNGINLDIQQGEFIAIVGTSGSGKSTLLNLLGGIDSPSEGTISINNVNLNNLNERELSRFRCVSIGFVFQFFQLMPSLTVLENVIMPMDFRGKLKAAQRKERARELLEKVGMERHAEKLPAALSGGEQQRTAIARALANNPDILFADEPTGNLDSKTTDEIFHLLTSLSKEGRTIIIVTHNNELASRCGRIIKMQDGLIIEDKKTIAGKEFAE
jgi:putative ABC transport system ATP-binding protein